VDDEQQQEWDQLSSSLGAGFLVRWDLYDRESLERAIATENTVAEEGKSQPWPA
jgi:hypothetical protein